MNHHEPLQEFFGHFRKLGAVVDILSYAGQSIRILIAADPNHPAME